MSAVSCILNQTPVVFHKLTSTIQTARHNRLVKYLSTCAARPIIPGTLASARQTRIDSHCGTAQEPLYITEKRKLMRVFFCYFGLAPPPSPPPVYSHSTTCLDGTVVSPVPLSFDRRTDRLKQTTFRWCFFFVLLCSSTAHRTETDPKLMNESPDRAGHKGRAAHVNPTNIVGVRWVGGIVCIASDSVRSVADSGILNQRNRTR